MSRVLQLLALMSLSCCAYRAQALESYFGLSYLTLHNQATCEQAEQQLTDAQTEFDSTKCDEDVDGKQFSLGVQPWSFLAFEVKYFNGLSFDAEQTDVDSDAGTADYAKLHSSLRSTSLSVVGIWDFTNHLSATASVGLANWNIRQRFYGEHDETGNTNTPPITKDDTARDRSSVIGLGLLLRGKENVALTINADRYSGIEENFGFDETLTVYSIGFLAKF